MNTMCSNLYLLFNLRQFVSHIAEEHVLWISNVPTSPILTFLLLFILLLIFALQLFQRRQQPRAQQQPRPPQPQQPPPVARPAVPGATGARPSATVAEGSNSAAAASSVQNTTAATTTTTAASPTVPATPGIRHKCNSHQYLLHQVSVESQLEPHTPEFSLISTRTS